MTGRRLPRRPLVVASLAASGVAVAIWALAAADADRGSAIPEGRRERVIATPRVTAWRSVYRPGEGAAMHEHIHERLVVVVSGGDLEITAPDGSSQRMTLRGGDVALREPERHALRNPGETTLELIEIDLPEIASEPATP